MKNQQQSRKLIVFTILSIILLTIWSANRRKENFSSGQNSGKTLVDFFQDRKQDGVGLRIEQRSSLGEKVLIRADDNPDKQFAVEQFAAGKIQLARAGFSSSLKKNPNDPEALIYLNNSIAALDVNAIKIGVSVPIGGSLNVAKEILRGVAQAQNEVNKAGGIEKDGVKRLVQISLANDDNNPDTAAEIAASFVEQPEIIGVVGHNSSNASITAAPVYQEGGLVMVSPTSVARELSQAGSYIFRTTPSTRILAETLAQYSVENIRRQKIAICSDSSSPASESFKEEFSLAVFELGGTVSNIKCDFSSENFNPDLIPSQAISDGSEALLLVPSVNNINQALEVVRSNKKKLTVLGNHSMYTYETLKIGQADLNGMVIPAAWHPNTTVDSLFNQNARKLWGTEGSWRTATAYDAAKAILTGLESASTRQELQKTLVNSGFATSGALGKISFQTSGDRQIKATLVKVQPGKFSGTGYDFQPLN